MAEERLSKLQKFILLFLYNKKRKTPDGTSFIESEDIYEDFFELPGRRFPCQIHNTFEAQKKARSAWPVVCACFKLMVKKGLLRRGSEDNYGNIKFDYEFGIYVLTDKGKKIAKILKLKLCTYVPK
jgi:hypothetical protein